MSPRYISVRNPIAPVLHDPHPGATQVTQLLYGHCAEIGRIQAGWLQVRCADGYEGWTHSGYTTSCEEDDAIGWPYDIEGPLSLGCTCREESGATLELPLGAVLGNAEVIAGTAMHGEQRKAAFPPSPDAIVGSAMGLFQGAYYQWGGVTPWGADCSGMTQTVFALHGIHLLRDAWQQATQGVALDGGIEAAGAADLFFFSDREDGAITHVAMGRGDSRVVHMALGRGGHYAESLAAADADEYGQSLRERFRFARRIAAS